MSVFLFRFAITPDAPSIHDVDLAPYLPRAPVSEDRITHGRAEIRTASFNAALDKPIVKTPGGFVFSQGYLPSAAFQRLSERLFDEQPITLIDYPESFCAVAYRDGLVSFISAGTGADQLFYMETPTALFVTNRHNLLGPFAKNLTLRKESFWWMAGRTHIGDFGTYWQEIQRTKPSCKYTFDGSLRLVETDYSGLFEPIPPDALPHVMADIVDHFARVMEDITAPKRISLTGGKDSRAILGLLSGTGQTDNLRANTSGTFFSPDVMAARKLTEALGIGSQHTISRPAIAQPPQDAAALITEGLLLDFAGRSLADSSKFSFAGDLVLGGHEAGIKSALNSRDIDQFVHDRRFWVDDRKVLAEDVRKHLTESYQDNLREALANIPTPYFDKIEGLEFRLPHRNSANITASHVGGSQLHPFYDGKIVRAICGMDPEILTAQYIPYYFTALGRVDLVSPRFAADSWPNELLRLATEQDLVENGRLPRKRGPYLFRPYFPTEKKFGMSSPRIDLCDMSATRLLDYINDYAGFFDYLDMETVTSLVSKPGADKTFREMYVHLGLLKSAIVHATSDRIFEFGGRPSIQSTVEDFLTPQNQDISRTNTASRQTQQLEGRIVRYEQAIAQMEEVIVATGDEAVCSEASQSATGDLTIEFTDLVSAVTGEYKIIPDEGLHIDVVENTRPLTLSGELIAPKLTNRSSLVLIENAPEAPFGGLSYSNKLGGYFCYLTPDATSGKFHVELRLAPGAAHMTELSVSIQKWQTEGPIIVAGLPELDPSPESSVPRSK